MGTKANHCAEALVVLIEVLRKLEVHFSFDVYIHYFFLPFFLFHYCS